MLIGCYLRWRGEVIIGRKKRVHVCQKTLKFKNEYRNSSRKNKNISEFEKSKICCKTTQTLCNYSKKMYRNIWEFIKKFSKTSTFLSLKSNICYEKAEILRRDDSNIFYKKQGHFWVLKLKICKTNSNIQINLRHFQTQKFPLFFWKSKIRRPKKAICKHISSVQIYLH